MLVKIMSLLFLKAISLASARATLSSAALWPRDDSERDAAVALRDSPLLVISDPEPMGTPGEWSVVSRKPAIDRAKVQAQRDNNRVSPAVTKKGRAYGLPSSQEPYSGWPVRLREDHFALHESGTSSCDKYTE